jgi:hypothetical protein
MARSTFRVCVYAQRYRAVILLQPRRLSSTGWRCRMGCPTSWKNPPPTTCIYTWMDVSPQSVSPVLTGVTNLYPNRCGRFLAPRHAPRPGPGPGPGPGARVRDGHGEAAVLSTVYMESSSQARARAGAMERSAVPASHKRGMISPTAPPPQRGLAKIGAEVQCSTSFHLRHSASRHMDDWFASSFRSRWFGRSLSGQKQIPNHPPVCCSCERICGFARGLTTGSAPSSSGTFHAAAVGVLFAWKYKLRHPRACFPFLPCSPSPREG